MQTLNLDDTWLISKCLNLQTPRLLELSFEKAYCQYRLNDFAGALKTLQNVAELGHREKELLAQVVGVTILCLTSLYIINILKNYFCIISYQIYTEMNESSKKK